MLCCRLPQETEKTLSADKCTFLKDNAFSDYFTQCHHSICAVNKYEVLMRLGHCDRFFWKQSHSLQFDKAEIKQDGGNDVWKTCRVRVL
jgi:hypothetical protein